MFRKYLTGGAAALALAVAFAPAIVEAQETTSSIRGRVLGPDGQPASGATVTITHVPSGSRSTATTNASGSFVATGLRVGGPYTVRVTDSQFRDAVAEGIFLELGEPFQLTITLEAQSASAEEIVVTGQQLVSSTLQTGPTSSFNEADVSRLPSISRDPKDVIRLDPSISIDSRNSDAIKIAGSSNRANSFTIDGIKQNDDFGLNNNGYPTQRAPISLDWIDQLAVNTAPYDVEYSGFQGANINVVTKSGENDFHGSAFYYFRNDDMVGDTSNGRTVNQGEVDLKFYGGTISGPIIPNRVFFFAGYEWFEELEFPSSFGPSDSGAANPVTGVTVADVDSIRSIAQSVYGVDTGTFGITNQVEDEKYVVKLDANILDNHRATVSYNYNEGSNVSVGSGSPFQVPGGSQRLALSSSWYKNNQVIEAYSGQLFSDWTDNFSTEIKYGYKEVETSPDPLNGKDSGVVAVQTSPGSYVYFGPDLFRHANYLYNETTNWKVKGLYDWNAHSVVGGWEREELEVFNLFVPSSLGAWVFNSITDFQNQVATSLAYTNATGPTVDPDSGAASFGIDVDSFYLQDTVDLTPEFTVQFGVRYEVYSTDEVIAQNPNFVARYNSGPASTVRDLGYDNTTTLDGLDLIMPRAGFNFQPSEDLVIRGGFGLFSGGNPTVWISNNYSNNGVSVGNAPTGGGSAIATYLTGPQDITLFAQSPGSADALAIQASLASSPTSEVNALDANFELPSTWKTSIGVSKTFSVPGIQDINLNFDALFTKVEKGLFTEEERYGAIVGTAPDGRPIYSEVSGEDYILKNTDQGRGRVLSVSLDKAWDFAWGDTFDLGLGYANQDVRDVSSMTSSTASSNYRNTAVSDPHNLSLATSNYEIEDRFVLSSTYRKEWVHGFATVFTLFGEHRSGQPFSYTFDVDSNLWGSTRDNDDRQLVYVPNSSDVVTDVLDLGGTVRLSGVTLDAFNSALAETGLDSYRGQIAPRNAFNSQFYTTFDLRIAQEIPSFLDGHKGIFSIDIENLGNLLNDEWGRLDQVQFAHYAPIFHLTGIESNGAGGTRYVLDRINSPSQQRYELGASESVWKVQLGVRYEF